MNSSQQPEQTKQVKFNQPINVEKNYQLRIKEGTSILISQASLPVSTGNKRKILQLQQKIRSTYTSPIVIARLLPGKHENVKINIEIIGPALLNFIVDCEDEYDRFIQVQLQGLVNSKNLEEEQEEGEEVSDFFLEDD